jgi:uncharacterized membrane protein (DUF373 family)
VEHWLHVGQDAVLVSVAATLLLAGLVVVFDAARELVNAIAARSIAEAIFSIVENALLALILAELVHTLLVALGGGQLTAEPFLVIGIVGILRKMLLTTVLAPKPAEAEALISSTVIELAALSVLILILSAALVLVRLRNPEGWGGWLRSLLHDELAHHACLRMAWLFAVDPIGPRRGRERHRCGPP